MKIKQYFLDYPNFKKAQTIYWITLFLLGIFVEWVYFPVCFIVGLLALMLGVGQNEDFLFQREINPRLTGFYHLLAIMPIFAFLAFLFEMIASIHVWVTFLLVTPPHLFFHQQFKWIAEQHNQSVIAQQTPTSRNEKTASNELTPFREAPFIHKTWRALLAIMLMIIGLFLFFSILYQWFETGQMPNEKAGLMLGLGLGAIFKGADLLK